ncbi:probable polygalacturonase, partial [Phalaenopsis equestris]|uniref:probable polygalacturonase n=1 Tax=Phalaenopsis equestris TaxID=78828 RepID=UPI0009E393EA
MMDASLELQESDWEELRKEARKIEGELDIKLSSKDKLAAIFSHSSDSCENMVIENSFICVGDDGIAIKSGWDQYGIAYGRPSTNILIRNVTLRSVVSAGLSIGSEMSGGVSNITMEDIHVWESRRGVRIKTAAGRGGL